MTKYSLEGLTGEQLKSAQNFNAMVDAIEAMKSNSEVAALKTKIEALESKETPDFKDQISKLELALEAQGTELAKQAKNEGMKQSMTIEDAVAKAVVAKQAEILSILKAGSGSIEIDVTKVVGDITTGSGTLPVAAPVAVGTQLAPLQNVNLRNLSVEQFMTVLATSNGSSYAYTESIPKDGDYTFVNEGASKPQIDFKWETRWATPKKIAAWMKLTEESVKDVVGLESVARDFLRKKHDLKKAKALLFGTGAGDEPTGATVYGRVFSAGGMALAIQSPNFMDVVNAAIVDIATTHNYEDETPYRANMVMVNSVDFFLQVVSAKTEEGVPLYPTAGLFNQVVIGGVTIVPDESIPAGKIFVADLGKFNITNYVPYMVKVGWINDDFIKNQFVILGESRFHQFVKKLDEQAFIYDDIATIKAAITAPLVVAGN
jgi:hypothetical protein